MRLACGEPPTSLCRGQRPVVADEVEAGRRDEGSQLLDELLGGEDEVGGSIARRWRAGRIGGG